MTHDQYLAARTAEIARIRPRVREFAASLTDTNDPAYHALMGGRMLADGRFQRANGIIQEVGEIAETPEATRAVVIGRIRAAVALFQTPARQPRPIIANDPVSQTDYNAL